MSHTKVTSFAFSLIATPPHRSPVLQPEVPCQQYAPCIKARPCLIGVVRDANMATSPQRHSGNRPLCIGQYAVLRLYCCGSTGMRPHPRNSSVMAA